MNDRLNSTRRWVDRVFDSPLPGGKDLRFTWPLPVDIPAAQEGLKTTGTPFIRATTAMMRAQVLFQEAVRLYVTDFATLAGKSASIQMKNAKHEPCTSVSSGKFDPAEMQSAVELQKLISEMVASATKESFAYWNERMAEVLPAMLAWDFEGVARHRGK